MSSELKNVQRIAINNIFMKRIACLDLGPRLRQDLMLNRYLYSVLWLGISLALLPCKTHADETQGTTTGSFVGLKRLGITTSDGPVTSFLIKLNNGKQEGFCLLGLTREERQVLKDPKNFIGRKCLVQWATAEAQLLDGEVVDLVALSSLKWVDADSEKSNAASKTDAQKAASFPFANMTMYFESPGADNAIFFESSTTGSAPFLAEGFRGGGIGRGAYQYTVTKKGNAKWQVQLSETAGNRMTVTVGPGVSKTSTGALKASGVLTQSGDTRDVDLFFVPGNRLDSASPPPNFR